MSDTSQTTTTELLPCPFCGDKATMWDTAEEEDRLPGMVVCCMNPVCPAEFWVATPEWSRGLLIAAWNRRHGGTDHERRDTPDC